MIQQLRKWLVKRPKGRKNVKLPKDTDANVHKGDFVLLVKNENSDEFSRVSKVKHDDIPHGLMMKIHDMKHMHH